MPPDRPSKILLVQVWTLSSSPIPRLGCLFSFFFTLGTGLARTALQKENAGKLFLYLGCCGRTPPKSCICHGVRPSTRASARIHSYNELTPPMSANKQMLMFGIAKNLSECELGLAVSRPLACEGASIGFANKRESGE